MTTPKLTPSVAQAIEEIKKAFPGITLEVEADADGGAFVKAHPFDIGSQFQPRESWCAFRITFQYPCADVYPHYFVPDLKRNDGKPLGAAINPNHQWQHLETTEPATMVSRRSNRLDSSIDTAALKLAKVLTWIRST
jgi:hypothetical protein